MAYIFVNIFPIANLFVEVLNWSMKIFIDFCVVIAGNTLCQNVIKCVDTKVHFGYIPVFIC